VIVLRRIERPHARVAAVDGALRVLLRRHERPGRPAFWALPGEPIGPGEPVEEGVRRLLRRAGLASVPAGPAVRRIVASRVESGEVVRHDDRLVLVALPDGGHEPPGGFRWWPLHGVGELAEPVYPTGLASLLRGHL